MVIKGPLGQCTVNTNLSTPARVLFESLEGRWTLTRILTGFGEMTGMATFRPLSRHVLEYREEGVLTLTSGTTHSAFRTLFYLHQGDHILVCFRPASRPKDLLHGLAVGRADVPWPQNVDDTHFCGADSYHGRYEFETAVRSGSQSRSVDRRKTRLSTRSF